MPNILKAYLGSQQLYSEITLDSSEKRLFDHYQWPIVSLEQGFQHKILLFQVYVGEAPSIYIGLFKRVIIGSQTALIKKLFQQELDATLGLLFTFLGLIALLLFLKRPDNKAYIYFGLLTISIGVYIVCDSEFIALFFKNHSLLDYVQHISFYSIPINSCLLFGKIFGYGHTLIIRHLWQINLVYAVAALLLDATQNDSWISSVYLDQVLFLTSSVILLLTTIKLSLTGNFEAKLFTFGFIVLALSAVHDLLIYIFEPQNWHQNISPLGTLVFIVFIGLIFEFRFNKAQQKLQDYAIELEAKNADLQENSKLKDEFLANTSHELKTPLNGIIGIAESLADGAAGKLSKQTVFNLSLIVYSGKRLSQLVNDLLDFSQLKHKKIELKIKPVGMREVADIVLMLCQPLIDKKKLQLINKIDQDLPPVDADENRVQQILYNLVGNAIKFTESGTIEVSATVLHGNSLTSTASNKEQRRKDQEEYLSNRVSYLEITVADTGIGIQTDKLDRIFESFEQIDGSIAREYGGAGLGLAVTKQLVQLHGGSIHAESTPGIGSRLIFTLPLSKGNVDNHQRKEFLELNKLSAIASIPNQLLTDIKISAPHQGNFKILVVDDELVNLQVLVNHLSLENYALTQASSGAEALEKIRNGLKPDLILLDVMMPKMTGYELCKKIREQFLPNELPVVLLTAKNQVSDLLEGFGAGANDYLTKPISKHELLARIKTHIQLANINVAYGRFVPHEFLKFLNRESIIDVQLGDQVLKEMTVLFADIRSFTSLSEQMSPKENFDFLNAYLSRVSPVIRDHHGFIDKYIGDAVMALFPNNADDAVLSAIEMQRQVSLYNSYRQGRGEESIAIGIGIHTGSLILGTVGESQRMETTVISDAVNLASRLEGLTKVYGVDILISEQTLNCLDQPDKYKYRFLDRVKVKGKSQAVNVFEVYDANSHSLRELKQQTLADFERGVTLYVEQNFTAAQQVFEQVLQINQQDRVTQLYIERCKKARRFGVSELDIVIS
ncbi:response regulator [Lyngbya aestuarii]|uniref:response regulator n=1 Tax=Lyngbya aestuarii TaxID=118322 RepID=UPI00403D9B85